jgi:hypothetical protein
MSGNNGSVGSASPFCAPLCCVSRGFSVDQQQYLTAVGTTIKNTQMMANHIPSR